MLQGRWSAVTPFSGARVSLLQSQTSTMTLPSPGHAVDIVEYSDWTAGHPARPVAPAQPATW